MVQKVLACIIPTGNEASVVLPTTTAPEVSSPPPPPKTPKRNSIPRVKFNERFVANCREKVVVPAPPPPTHFPYGYNYSAALYPPEMMWHQQPCSMQVPPPHLPPPPGYTMMPMPVPPPGWQHTHPNNSKSFHNNNSNNSTATTDGTSIDYYSTTTGESSYGSSCLSNDLCLTNDLVKYVEQTLDEFTEGISDIIVGCSDAICDCSKKKQQQGSVVVRNDDETTSTTTWDANRQGGTTTTTSSITPTKMKLLAKIKHLESIVHEKNKKSLESSTTEEVSLSSSTQTKEEEDLRLVHYDHTVKKEDVNYFPTFFTVNDDDDAVEEDLEVKSSTAATKTKKLTTAADRRSKSVDRLKKLVHGVNPFKMSTTSPITTACTTKEMEIVANISGNITSDPVIVLPSSSSEMETPNHLSISSRNNKKLDPIDLHLLRSSSEKRMPNLIDQSPVSVDYTTSLDHQPQSSSTNRKMMDYPLELSRTQVEC
jgi:hypothetical protein